MTKICFKIKKIMYRNNDRYTITRVKLLKQIKETANDEITVKGYFPSIFVGDEYECEAEYFLDKTRGYYFQLIDMPVVTIPENTKTLATFLSRRIKGLSQKKALEIVETLGLETLTLIKKDYRNLLKVNGIKEKKAKMIYGQIIKYEEFERLAIFIQGLCMSTNLASKIYDKYGDESIDVVRSNPYSICYDYAIPFTDADKIAYKLKFTEHDDNRIRCAVSNFLNDDSRNNGNLCTNKKTIYEKINDYLNIYGCFKGKEDITVEEVNNALDYLLIIKKIVIEERDGEEYVYLSYNNYNENQIATFVSHILYNKITPFCLKEDIDKFIAEYEKKYFILDIKQIEAIETVLTNNMSIITGGPGTGKTQTVNAIVKCIQYINPAAKIKLLAPTGRASHRITELTNMKASTIHRALGLNAYNRNSCRTEIEADFVIVDESSMIDSYIFEKLISILGDDTRILFIGDVNQLPSVGPGNVLHDMIDSGKIPVIELVKIFRQSKNSNIVLNAHRIIAGLTSDVKNGIDIKNKKGTDFFFCRSNDIVDIRQKISKCIDRLMTRYSVKFNDIIILTAMRKGELGSESLNRYIQQIYNPNSPHTPEIFIDEMHSFRVKDRVMQTKNDYDLSVFNGEIGIVNKIYTEVDGGVEVRKMDVDFPDRDTITYDDSNFDELQLAYSITIHKAQGSEIPYVIIPIHQIQKSMLNRNLFYTGVTRAKKMCTIIGEEDMINYAIKNIDNTKRLTFLKEKLIKSLKGGI